MNKEFLHAQGAPDERHRYAAGTWGTDNWRPEALAQEMLRLAALYGVTPGRTEWRERQLIDSKLPPAPPVVITAESFEEMREWGY